MAGLIERGVKQQKPADSGELFTTDILAATERAHTDPQFLKLPLSGINILPQARVVFEGLDQLAASLVRDRQINPPFLARWTPDEAQGYINLVNAITRSAIQLDNLQTTTDTHGEVVVDILIAGERRVRAAKTLTNTPCESCTVRIEKQKTADNIPPSCFDTHFPDGFMFNVNTGLTPEQAVSIQTAENLHEKPNPWEEAPFIRNYFELLRLKNPNLTKSEFAIIIRRSPETVRDALRFCELTSETQQHVYEGRIPYSVAVMLATLKEKQKQSPEITDGQIRHFEDLALIGEDPIKLLATMRRYARIAEEQTQFTNGLFDDERNNGGMAVEGVNSILSDATKRRFYQTTDAIRRIRDLVASGRVRTPLTSPAVIRIIDANITAINSILGTLTTSEQQELMSKLNGAQEIVAALAQQYPED